MKKLMRSIIVLSAISAIAFFMSTNIFKGIFLQVSFNIYVLYGWKELYDEYGISNSMQRIKKHIIAYSIILILQFVPYLITQNFDTFVFLILMTCVDLLYYAFGEVKVAHDIRNYKPNE